MKKIISATVVIWAILSFQSCGKEELDYTIPRERVSFQVNLNSLDNILNSVGGYQTYTKPRLSNEYVGYAGLLVYSYSIDMDGVPLLVAYDLCCPYEDQRSVTVSPNAEGKAVCAKCKSVYDMNTGRPLSGPSQERLQPYYVNRQNPYNGVFTVQN